MFFPLKLFRDSKSMSVGGCLLFFLMSSAFGKKEKKGYLNTPQRPHPAARPMPV